MPIKAENPRHGQKSGRRMEDGMLYWLYRIQGEEVVSASTVEAPDDESACRIVDAAELAGDDSVEVWSRRSLVRAKRRVVN